MTAGTSKGPGGELGTDRRQVVALNGRFKQRANLVGEDTLTHFDPL